MSMIIYLDIRFVLSNFNSILLKSINSNYDKLKALSLNQSKAFFFKYHKYV